MKNIYKFILVATFVTCMSSSYAQTVSGYYSVGCTAYTQEHSQWCWAATCRMVDWTYSSVTPPSQCTIVNKANNQCDVGSCCSGLSGSRPSACVDWSPSNQPLAMYGCNGSLSWLMNYYAGANTSYSTSLTYSTVSSNLSANKMMVARWQWSNGTGHFVALYACYVLITGSGSTQNVSYANPSSGSKVTESYAYFKSNSSRTWTHSLRMNGAAVRRDGVAENNVIEMENSVRIYPNPSEGTISIERTTDLESDATLQISDALGQVVYEKFLSGQDDLYSFDLAGILRSGLYYVSVLQDGEKQTGKLIVK